MKTLQFLSKPRFSPLFFIVAIVCIFTVNTMTLKYYLLYIVPSIYEEVIPSPLLQIAVGKKGEPVTNAYAKPYDFGRDAFTQNILVWEKILKPYKNKPNLRYLEVGTFEGRSVIWMLENILTEPSAKATTIDIFDGPFKNKYFANIKLTGVSDKVTTITNYSQLALRDLAFESFDIIYIDGSHVGNDVLEDAVLSWRLLKTGGLLIFDDYRMIKRYAVDGVEILEMPQMAIDGFAQCFEKYFEVVHNEYQLILKRNKKRDCIRK